MDDARSRLQWASSRRTTRPEDIAYSLFGIFNLHLPVLYGESAENALGRLLAEIISQSGEISVLDWVGEASTFHSCFPAHITSYRTLPLSPHHQPDAEERASTMGEKFTPSKALRKLHDSLAKSPLPRFINRRLILPCLVHRVTMVQLKKRCTYEIQASGLRPLEIALPHELENADNVASQSTGTEATSAEHVILTLGRPFNALLLTKLPHDEYKRIASSTLIVAQPVDSASLLQSKIRTFTIV
ncbi:hypothetical protein F5J12DRAFT_861792 [Pisolithus orientalis]|uniref:uncharacterized protein n=1 Tax=Pisolithus orientalis TaxID=936130 RepID=UPI002224A4B8|nr:uncharacterized protein F5J12DRAFT_861792 [Pisolithus orientalis]KAI5991316.1 hypothetical protein F5J12DRAFT_861792 [Pisolithus orientalis]